MLGGLLLDHFSVGFGLPDQRAGDRRGIVAAAILVPESRNREASRRSSTWGVLLSIAGLVLLVYGIVQGGDSASWLHLGVIGPIVGGLAILALFAWYGGSQHPSLDVRLFRDRRLSASIGSLGLMFFSGMGGVFSLPPASTCRTSGATPAGSGPADRAVHGQLLMSPRGARIVQHYGAKAVGATGMFVMAAAIAGYATLGTDSPIWLLGVLFGIQGAAISVSMSRPLPRPSWTCCAARRRLGADEAPARQVAVAL